MSDRKSTLLAVLLAVIFFQTASGQDALSESELENLLTKAERESQNYAAVFRNLSADETKTKFRFKNTGEIDEKRVIKSVFVVYQSPNAKGAQEFRHVLEFNGKNVSRSTGETADFFEKLARAGTSEQAYAKIRKESLRYDGNRVSWGMTLVQSRPFSENLRAAFRFRVVGKERIEGRAVWLIEYEQTKPSPYVLSNPTAEEPREKGATEYNMPLPDALRPTNPLIKGRVWLDAATGQIWRNEFRVILNPARFSRPIETTALVYEYQPSKFGILAPKRFVIRTFQIKGDRDRDLTVTKDAETVYEYQNFSEFKTEAKEYQTEKPTEK